MKSIIRSSFLFILLLTVLVSGLQWSIDWLYKKRDRQKFSMVFDHEIDKEIMIFGSSIAYHGFDTRILQEQTGRPAYNMGWDGYFFVQYNSLIQEYISYAKKCKYLVIACSFDNFDKNALITRPDLLWAYLDNQHVYNAMYEIEPQKTFRARYIPGYKLSVLNEAFYKTILFGPGENGKLLGYGPVNAPADSTFEIKPYNANNDEQIFSALSETVNSVTAKGIKVVIAMVPLPEEHYSKILNAEQIKARYRSLISKNVYFLDYTQDSTFLEGNYFRDKSHLTLEGSTMLSRQFAKDLIQLDKRAVAQQL